jgi:Na+-driven multidrug efflux pump
MQATGGVLLRLGLDGAAITNILVTGVEIAMLLCYVIYRERRLAGSPEKTWHGW